MKKDAHSKIRSIGRFWSMVERTKEHWHWRGGKTCRVLGQETRIPRRVAWLIDTGKAIPDGMDLEVTCGVEDCVCPQHMRLVPEKPRSRRGAGMVLLLADIPAAQLAWLEERAREQRCSKNHIVREVIAAGQEAFRLAEGSEGRAVALSTEVPPVDVSENPTET